MSQNPIDGSTAPTSRFGLNPFLEVLGPQIPYLDMAQILAFSPLSNMTITHIPLAQREELLIRIKKHFLPTRDAQKIAAAMQTLLRAHYTQRNPFDPAVRRQVYALASHRDKNLSGIPWLSGGASGLIVSGITGLGKSTIIERYLALLPQQVVEYSASEIPGYAYVKQIVWLKVDMSVDGSRGGFLLAILASVDQLIGTDYHDQYAKGRWTVEKLMVRVGIVLSAHFCGMLIIEEIQAENFSDSKWLKELATFFLRLLNFGIPVVLVGNPMGFTKLSEHSQLMRRLTFGGCFRMEPSESPVDFEWKKVLVPGIWEFDVMPEKTELNDEISAALFQYSGGINDFLARLRIESQKNAIRRGENSVSLAHIREAYDAETFVDNHGLIQGFTKKDYKFLSAYKDVPAEHYKQRWEEKRKQDQSKTESGTSAEAHVELTESPAHPEPTQKTSGKSKESRFKSQQTTAKKRSEKVQLLNNTLDKEDMRRDGAKASLLQEFENLKKKFS